MGSAAEFEKFVRGILQAEAFAIGEEGVEREGIPFP